jgi:hypothetical protein
MDWRNRLVTLCCTVNLCLATAAADGKALCQKHCAGCHDASAPRVPDRNTLEQLSPQAILDALETENMRAKGTKLTLNASLRSPHTQRPPHGRLQHRKQVPFVTALYRAPRHLRLRLRHHPRLLQIASVATLRFFSGKRTA